MSGLIRRPAEARLAHTSFKLLTVVQIANNSYITPQ